MINIDTTTESLSGCKSTTNLTTNVISSIPSIHQSTDIDEKRDTGSNGCDSKSISARNVTTHQPINFKNQPIDNVQDIIEHKSNQRNGNKLNEINQALDVSCPNSSIIQSNNNTATSPVSRKLNTSVQYNVKNLEHSQSIVNRFDNKIDKMEVNKEYIGEDELLVSQFIEKHSGAVEKWLKERASPEWLARIHAIIDDKRPTKSPKRPSVTSDLFQQWLASSPVKKCRSPTSRTAIQCRRHLENLNENELFMELCRDVANELDIDVLCHKILVNVGLLTHADRGSLFLAKGSSSSRYLVAKLFDVTQDTALADAVRLANTDEINIPFGVGIAGTVAQSKETINIKDAYKDPRFNSGIDHRTGYKTTAILSMPICNYEGEVIGVAQIINKTNDTKEFTAHDEEVFRRYLTFCGIGIQNAQLFQMSVQEYRRNEILLNLARSIFEEQNNLKCLVTKIMREARDLLKCERCAVYLLALDCCEANHLQKIIEKPIQPKPVQNPPVLQPIVVTHQPLSRRQSHNVNVEDILAQQSSRGGFTVLFELNDDTPDDADADEERSDITDDVKDDKGMVTDDFKHTTLAQIAQHVANTGQILNLGNIKEWLKEHPDITIDDKIDSVQSIFCMPIVNGQNVVIGVAQLLNKENGNQFTEADVSILEAFAIFCGLGIHNTQMYENACKLMAKQKVALECLSYHATASNEQTVQLVNDTIRTAESYGLYTFKFIDFDLSDDDTCRATVRMFLQCNLVQQFHIPYDVLCRWILSVKKNYRPVKYHNWRHGFNVTQTMFTMLKTAKMERFVTDLDIFGLLVACLCHDLDHRGTNNAFQMKTDSPLAILYTTSTMEHHHFDQCIMILNSEGNNIFQALSPEDYRQVMATVENAILSTDLAVYFDKQKDFTAAIDNGVFDFQSDETKNLLCGMMMTSCDVSAIAKPWEVQHRVAKLVADEFFVQGDIEKTKLNQQPVAMMDRDHKDDLPIMQVSFIDSVCVPLYTTMAEAFPWLRPLLEGTLENRKNWVDLADKVKMGLTWIDHDTIDKPVEIFTDCPEDLKDIEFTVTTLHCNQEASTIDTTPERRPRFHSLRKTGALSKAVRSRLSKSFYHNHSHNKDTDNVTVTVHRLTEETNNGRTDESEGQQQNGTDRVNDDDRSNIEVKIYDDDDNIWVKKSIVQSVLDDSPIVDDHKSSIDKVLKNKKEKHRKCSQFLCEML